MPQNKHKSWCGAQHQQATKDKKNDQEWTYLGTGTKKDFPTSFDKHIAGRHTGEDAEAKKVQKKKKGRNKISPGLQLDWAHTDSRKDGTIPIWFQELNPAYFEERIHSSSARSVIDLCPGSGEARATSSVLEEKTKELQDFAAQRRKMINDSISLVIEERTVPEMTNILKSTRDSAS